MKSAFDYAKINKFKYLAFIDGDCQHEISDLEKSSGISDSEFLE